jgi:lipoprotein-releasing system permease protein
MRFEFSIALKYLLPRKKQLSVSIISLVSICVISLVVWLLIVFLSVTEGIEKKWVRDLVTFVAPIKIKPTEAYYRSYYYLIDEMSIASGFAKKTIKEKLSAENADPYDPEIDPALPPNFPRPDRHMDQTQIDPVKETWAVIQALDEKGLIPREYEVSFGNLRLIAQREDAEMQETDITHYNQVCYVTAFDPDNQFFMQSMLPLSDEDIKHFETTNQAELQQPPTGLSWYLQKGAAKQKLPNQTALGAAILVAKNYYSSGLRLGDRGFLSAYQPTASTSKELRVPVYVAGFYDPGVMSMGNKLIFIPDELMPLFSTQLMPQDSLFGNGINLWFEDLSRERFIKEKLASALKDKGLDRFWRVESFRDYEFTRPILQQLESDKTLFTLLSLIILVVACSNIISMLLLLVNAKKKEIGILRSMGAPPSSIATIFGLCGFTTGVVSCCLGILFAVLTLQHLHTLVGVLSYLQGHEVFQAPFYGTRLPNELSLGAVLFVIIATLAISLLAGLIPAIKATRIRTTDILRAE